MNRRKRFAEQLNVINNSKYFVIFIHEVPFYLVMRSLEYSRKRKRAKMPTQPVGGMSHRTQVAMSVHAHKGVILRGVFPPEYSQSVSKHGSVSRRKTLKASWNEGKSKEYLDGLLQSLFTRRDEMG